MTTDRAKVLANFYSETGDASVFASIYDDGVILYLMKSAKTQWELEEVLGKRVRERARSDDGFCGVIILPFKKFPRTFDKINEFFRARGDNLKFNDNRERDAHTITLYCSMLEDRLARS